MAIKPRKLTAEEKAVWKELANSLRKEGLPHTADYVEMFGLNLNPWFHHLTPIEQRERFYKMCVEAKLPWSAFEEDLPDDVKL